MFPGKTFRKLNDELITAADEAIGKVIQSLKDADVVIFTSDNEARAPGPK